jgi:hypothetical protein
VRGPSDAESNMSKSSLPAVRPIALVALSLASALGAQTGFKPRELVGLTHALPAVVNWTIASGGCKLTACSAKALGVGSRVADRAGGTAWDGRQSRVWVSNGVTLALLNPHSATAACGLACKPAAAPLPPGTGTRFVTGLEFVEAGVQPKPGLPGPTGLLYLSYNNQVIGRVPVKRCAIGTPAYCSLRSVLGTRRIIGGLAADDARGFLFVGTSSSVSTSPANVVFVTSASRPCQVLCKFAVAVDQNKCSKVRLGPITGLAYDGCADILYITDGKVTMFGKVTVTTSPVSCRFVHLGCCASSATERLVGLAVRPTPSVVHGRTCTNGDCLRCPAMAAGSIGDPVLGNGDFAFTLNRAPGNFTTAVLAVGFGPCHATGLRLGFCDNIRVALGPFRPLVLAFGNRRPGTACRGEMRVPVAMPVRRSLCGLNLSVQWIVVCPKGGSGVTPCVSMKVQGI